MAVAKKSPVTKKSTPVKKTVRVEAKSKESAVETAHATKGMMPVYAVTGEKTGEMAIPGIFSGESNMQLVAQAIRVYRANQREGSASTKTRGLVEGSTRKIYKQKGTGRARHGSIRANVFVGGGIVFGPQPRDYSLKLTQEMKNEALRSAFALKMKDHAIVALDASMNKPKTKTVASGLSAMGATRGVMIIVEDMHTALVKSARNIRDIVIRPANLVTTYDVVMSHMILCTKEGVGQLEARLK